MIAAGQTTPTPNRPPVPWGPEQALAPIMAQAGPGDLLVIAGENLGPWLAAAAMEGGPKVLAYLAGPNGRREKEKLAGLARGAILAGDEAGLMEALGRELVYGHAARVRLVVAPEFEEAEPELAQRARRAVDRGLTRGRLDRATRRQLTGQWLGRLAANTTTLLAIPDIAGLSGVLAGVPAIVAGAGPSLDKSLPALTAARGKAAVFAAASALKPLAGAGLPAHFALALEAKDESRQFQGLKTGQTVLAAASSSHPNHFAKWQGPKALFHLLPVAAALTGGQVLPTGGHAGSAAFSLAFLMGCDPIIMVGQDLAFTGGKVHAASRPGGEESPPDAPVAVEALNGRSTLTSPAMLSYLAWYQEAAGYLKTHHPERLVVNASAEGARLAGFPHAPLSWLLNDLKPLNTDLNAVAAALPRLPKPEAGFISGRLHMERAHTRNAMNTLDIAGMASAAAACPLDSGAALLLDLYSPGEEEQVRKELTHLLELMRLMEDGLYG